MNDSQADSLQTRKSERNVARAAKCATDKGLGKTCDVPGKGKGGKPIAAFLQSSSFPSFTFSHLFLAARHSSNVGLTQEYNSPSV